MDTISALRDKYRDIPQERFFEEAFEKEVYKDAREQKADVVVDLGALAGEFSAYMYDIAKEIYAIEMFSGAYKELTDNIKEFKLSKIKPYHLAIGMKNGSIKIRTDEVQRGGHRIEAGEENEKVPCKTLETFMKDEGIEHIDVLKIDIEGIEEQLFADPSFERIADKITYIIGEHAGTHLLKKLGFHVEDLGPVWTAKRL